MEWTRVYYIVIDDIIFSFFLMWENMDKCKYMLGILLIIALISYPNRCLMNGDRLGRKVQSEFIDGVSLGDSHVSKSTTIIIINNS